MIHFSITLTHIISFTIGFFYFNIINHFLDKKTRPKNDTSDMKLKYALFFTTFNFLCFFFLKQIQEKRKIEYFQNRLNTFNMLYAVDIKYNMLSEDKKQEMRDMDMYLKLKRIKKRSSKWSNILEMVKK